MILPKVIPQEFPVQLIPFSTKVQAALETLGIQDASGLISHLTENAPASFGEIEAIGSKAIQELESFAGAIQSGTADALVEWFPLDTGGDGVSLSVALANVPAKYPERNLSILKRRLVDGLTLQGVADEFDPLTRKRVRQIEWGFLQDIEGFLTFFAGEQEKLRERWNHKGKNRQLFLQGIPEVELLGMGAVFSIFKNGGDARIDDPKVLSLLESNPRFWMGTMNLSRFLEKLGFGHLHPSFVRLSNDPEYYYDEGTDILSPTVQDPKSASLAYFRQRNGRVHALDLLDFLNHGRAGSFESITPESLQGDYWESWKGLHEFEGYLLVFPENWGTAILAESPGRPGPGQPQPDVHPDEGDLGSQPIVTPGGLDALVRDKIKSFSPTLLGLLPIEQREQDQILLQVRTWIDGDSSRLCELVKDYPGLGAYACVVSVSKGMVGMEFWGTFEAEDSLNVIISDQSSKDTLTDLFIEACKELGLETRSVEQNGRRDNVNVFLGQAAIISQWVQDLADAIVRISREGRIPSPSAPGAVEEFTSRLLEVIPYPQRRLLTFLGEPGGGYLAKTLLEAKGNGDFRHIPVHMRLDMQAALDEAAIRGHSGHIRAPFAEMFQNDEDVEVPWLTFPRQSSKVANDQTTWRYVVKETGERDAFCHLDGENDGVRLGDGKAEVYLENLKDGTSRKWEICGWPDQDDPIKVYELVPFGNYEVWKLRTIIPDEDEGTRRVFLPRGDYKFLTLAGTNFLQGGEWTPIDEGGSQEVSLDPQAESEASFAVGGKRWIFELELEPGFWLAVKNKIALSPQEEDRRIYYSDFADVWAYLHESLATDEDTLKVHFRVGGQSEEHVQTLKKFDENAKLLWADLKGQFDELLSNLSPGIHRIQISTEGAKAEGRLYWKGLRYHTKGKFKCDEFPADFDETLWRGLKEENGNLVYEPGKGAPDVILCCEGDPIRVPKDRVFVTLNDGAGGSLIIPEGEHLEVFDQDSKETVFETSDPSKWKLVVREADGTPREQLLHRFTDRKSRFRQAMDSLVVSYPDHNQVWAIERDATGKKEGDERLLFSFSHIKPASFRLDLENNSATFIMPNEIHSLKFGFLDLLATDTDEDPEDLGIQTEYSVETLKSRGITSLGCGKVGSLTISMVRAGRWELQVLWPENLQVPSVYALDIFCKQQGDKDWTYLKLKETEGSPSAARLILSPDGIDSKEEDPVWKKALLRSWNWDPGNAGLPDIRFSSLSKDDISKWFRRFQDHLLVKYHSKIWNGQAKWLAFAYLHFCKHGFSSLDHGIRDTFAISAVEGLDRRANTNFNELSISSNLAFSHNFELLAVPSCAFQSLAGVSTNSPVLSTFSAIGRLGRDEPEQPELRLNGYVWEPHYQSGKKAPVALANLPFLLGFTDTGVFGGKFGAEWLPSHNLEVFGDLIQEEIWGDSQFDQDTVLLSEEHIGIALRKLAHRCTRLKQSSDPGQGLYWIRKDIDRISGQPFEKVSNLIKKVIWDEKLMGNIQNLLVPLPWKPKSIEYKLGNAIFLLAGLVSLAASGKLGVDAYLSELEGWLRDHGGENEGGGSEYVMVRLLLSQGPEWFALCRLHWEIVNRII